MVELNTSPDPSQLNSIFHALSDATRRNMLQELSSGERTVSELAKPYDMSLAAASKHIRVLENAGLIKRTITGRIHNCHIEAKPLANVQDWLSRYERFWTERLDILDRLLREENASNPPGFMGEDK